MKHFFCTFLVFRSIAKKLSSVDRASILLSAHNIIFNEFETNIVVSIVRFAFNSSPAFLQLLVNFIRKQLSNYDYNQTYFKTALNFVKFHAKSHARVYEFLHKFHLIFRKVLTFFR